MADQRCPTCGKLNPASAEVCQFCQAPLLPQPAGDEESDSAEWLRGLLGEDSEPPEPPTPGAEQPPEPGESIPDWLARIRERTQIEDATSKIGIPPQVEPSAAPQPDWLDNLAGGEGSTAASVDDVAAWLKSLEESDEETPSPPAPPSPPTPPAKSLDAEQPKPAPTSPEEDEWLQSLTARIQASQAIEDELFSAEPEPGETAAQPAAPGDVPEWLQELPPLPSAFTLGQPKDQGSEPEAQPQQPEPSSPTAETPDWLQGLPAMPDAFTLDQAGGQPASTPEPAPASAEIPDWLSTLQPPEQLPVEGPAEPPAEAPAVPKAASTGELPDWLSASAEPSSESLAAESPQPAQTGELPSWLTESAEPPQPVPLARTGELPAWLSDAAQIPTEPESAEALSKGEEALSLPEQPLRPEEEIPAEPPLAAEPELPLPAREAAPASAESVPDWLAAFASAGEEETAPGPIPLSTSPAELELPAEEPADWLTPPAAEYPPSTPPLEGVVPEEILPPGEIPDWLKAIAAPPEEAPAAPSAPFGAEMPDWMKSAAPAPGTLDSESQGEPLAEPVSPLASQDVEEMLSGIAAEPESGEATAEPGAESLEPAQLPAWLRAMRPVEAAAPAAPVSTADDQRIEKAGPLAGLRGVLNSEDAAAQYRKPPVYTNKLQLSEKQRLHTSLLEGLIASETQPQLPQVEMARNPQILIRLVVALLLIALILVPPLAGFSLPLPADLASTQAGLSPAYSAIKALPAGANVLIAADFETSVTGEMKAAALPLLRHLATLKPRAALISTVPAGPVVGKALLSEAGLASSANLGYLAGGASALKMLATHASAEVPTPLQQLVPFPYPTGITWSDPSLSGLEEIDSFQLIIVLTDSVENARIWIEQVQPALAEQVKLLVVSSAQAAPLVRTYLDSGQVSGMVAGMAGGAAYEQLTRQPGFATSSWTAYQLTMLFVALLVIVGALAAGFSAPIKRRQSKGKA